MSLQKRHGQPSRSKSPNSVHVPGQRTRLRAARLLSDVRAVAALLNLRRRVEERLAQEPSADEQG
jgi:hypothetical protein